MSEQNIELIQLGSLLFLSAYHVILFFQVRRYHYLYLALLGVVILTRAMLVDDGSGLLYELLPSLDHFTGRKIEAFVAFSTLVITPLFFNDLYRFPSLKKYVRFFQIEGFVFIAMVPLVPFEVVRGLHNVFNISVVGVFVLVFVIVYKAILSKQVGAKYIFYGVIVCFVFVFVELVKRSNLTPEFEIQGPNLVNTGVLLLFFFQSISLSAIYAKSFRENERLNKGLEERVSTRTEQLSKSNLIKERFIKIVSHDFREPMISLKTMLALVESDSISKQQSIDLRKKIGLNLDRSLNMLDDLLEWTKASSESKVKIFKEPVDIKKLISDALIIFDDIATRKNISLQFDPKGEAPVLVNSDINSVKVVLRNLINNSIKFTGENGVVEAGFKRKGRLIEVFVADTGIGVPDEMKPTIFDMESANRRVGTGNEKSTGVGLALCKDLVTQNGGKIWLQDNFPAGTIFKFTLDLSS